MSISLTFDPAVSRVRIAATALTGATTALFEHSKNGLLWTTVRAGTEVPVTADAAALDDYEFQPNAANYYRVTGSPGGVTFTDSITPVQLVPWIKSITRPFLNRALKVVDYGDVSRPSRGSLFEVIGRTAPLAVTDSQGSRRWQLTIKGDDLDEADAIELVFASGDPLFIQVGQSALAEGMPTGYVLVGDMVRRKFGHESRRRWFDLDLTEVAAPAADVYGVPATWATLAAEFGSWSAVVATFPTWQDVVDYIADPSIVIVP
jgi:hypothetical protein